jgi:hypothetical protein
VDKAIRLLVAGLSGVRLASRGQQLVGLVVALAPPEIVEALLYLVLVAQAAQQAQQHRLEPQARLASTSTDLET